MGPTAMSLLIRLSALRRTIRTPWICEIASIRRRCEAAVPSGNSTTSTPASTSADAMRRPRLRISARALAGFARCEELDGHRVGEQLGPRQRWRIGIGDRDPGVRREMTGPPHHWELGDLRDLGVVGAHDDREPGVRVDHLATGIAHGVEPLRLHRSGELHEVVVRSGSQALRTLVVGMRRRRAPCRDSRQRRVDGRRRVAGERYRVLVRDVLDEVTGGQRVRICVGHVDDDKGGIRLDHLVTRRHVVLFCCPRRRPSASGSSRTPPFVPAIAADPGTCSLASLN